MSLDNLKICVSTILMILICLGLFCSGSFDTSNPLFLLHDASAQNSNGSPLKDLDGLPIEFYKLPDLGGSYPFGLLASGVSAHIPITNYTSLLPSGFIDPYKLLSVEPIQLIDPGVPVGMLPLKSLLPMTNNGFNDFTANYMYIQPCPYISSSLG